MQHKSINNQQLAINHLSSFTLIELLVVIAILGVLSALLFPNFMGARERARDIQRKSDLRSIAGALELYSQDKLPIAYPTGTAFLSAKGNCWSSGGIGTTCPAGNIYMKTVPVDPSSTSSTTVAYSYTSTTSPGFTLCTCLENVADSEGIVCSTVATCGSCISNKCFVIEQ
ncbi:MAG: hypothetical protein UR91_C0032G0004 [Candidatus Nomurabacteria bacterium GW2011_GWC2_35_8]|uniref:Type II secretion system protein GspG C-terminal domain-containing protein n=1 Tax=Candidatus Nomurabacteria bacterium GW2011_GWC2_35_8 TaxID=1618752 RepID=A0A0G0DGN4_9BACT|nr:MAG: hypothetical protein UR91_C0032G0004 [Candidatus Nomurabacteria bacterium GW2011_GWC2_35_8]